ncbi:MAG: porin [Flavobacteriales bacterium]
MKKSILPLACLLAFSSALCAQTEAPKPKKERKIKSPFDHSYQPMKINLNPEGTKFIRFITWHQQWISVTQNNQGTLDSDGQPQRYAFDVGIRRSRFLIHAQISPRFLIVSHFGINNQSFINGGVGAVSNYSGVNTTLSNGGKRPQLYIHDAWTEFAVVPGYLHLGTGLHYWNGVSRLASQSTLNFMTLDAPIHNWYNIEATDQFARQLGIYAKGQIGRLDYRLAVNKPFAFGISKNTVNSPIATYIVNEKVAFQGYLNWMFWDKENNTLPYFVGSYLGKKKVLNVGAGFYAHPGATANRPAPTDSIRTYAQQNYGIDLFLDMPVGKKKNMSVNLYSSFTYHNYGPDFLRNLGILNIHPAVQSVAVNPNTSWAGGGNSQPTLGTGYIWYTQFGFQLPRLKNGNAFMPYAVLTLKNFERLGGRTTAQLDAGLNYHINDHNAKITLQYSTRPTYKSVGGSPVYNGWRYELILQTHIFL